MLETHARMTKKGTNTITISVVWTCALPSNYHTRWVGTGYNHPVTDENKPVVTGRFA